MTTALRLPLLILASVLSLYAAFWFFAHVSMKALLLKSSLFAFLLAIMFLFFGIASLSGIAQACRRHNLQSAPGEALSGFLLMLACMLFEYLLRVLH